MPSRRLVVLVTALALALALAGGEAAVAGKRTAHVKDVTVRLAVVEGPTDGRFVTVGTMSDGAVVYSRSTVAEGGQLHARTRAYYPDGSIVFSRETYTLTPDGNGGFTLKGTGKDVRGTKRFKGITGTYTISGTQPAGAHVADVHLEGERIY
jgi:hypothetical protein